MIPLLLCLLAALTSPAPRTDQAQAVVRRAIDAVGGRAALDAIKTLRLETIGHDYFIEQSERPEGPFIVDYVSTVEARDVAGRRSRIETRRRSLLSADWSNPSVTIIAADAAVIERNGRFAPAGRQALDDGRERIELAPERLLLTALDAPDLASAPDEIRQAVVQNVVTFSWRGHRARLLINSHDWVPTALELTMPDTWGIWGDVVFCHYFSLWTLLPGGVRYPLQIDETWNGITQHSTTALRVTPNAPLDMAVMAIPDDVPRAFAALPPSDAPRTAGDLSKRRRDIAPGVVQYAGGWNVNVVDQPDGLVIIEAPIGSWYSAAILDQIAKDYPGKKIKAVVTTCDSWPHLGGTREYVARGIPLYALDLNRPILERLWRADYGTHPDALAKAPRAPRVTWVSNKTVIGNGDSRVEIYPARAENGERMLFAYIPAQKVLYTSDEVQRMPDGAFFMPEYLFEVKDVIAREGLRVDRIFGMHVGPTPWSDIEQAIARAIE